MEKPVSIIVPAFNRAHLICETLDSVVAQTYRPIELLIVDDGSTDSTTATVEKWLHQNSIEWGRILSLRENVGKSTAVNRALEEMGGDYVMVLDSDDILLEDAIALEVEFLETHPAAGMVFGTAYEMRGDIRTHVRLGGDIGLETTGDVCAEVGDMLLRVNPIVSSTVMLRTEVVRRVGLLNPDLRYTHDWEYWIRVSRLFKIGFLNRPVVHYRTGLSGASSGNRLGTFREIVQLLRREIAVRDRWSLLAALFKQIRFNTRLAYHDRRLEDVGSILAHGFISALWFSIRKGKD
jgi:glycosyltransferase involved in cell wall biosynthesis